MSQTNNREKNVQASGDCDENRKYSHCLKHSLDFFNAASKKFLKSICKPIKNNI